MKTSRSFTLTMLGLVAILMPMHLAAQSGTFSIAVPFDFAVGSQPFPAGEYRVSSSDSRIDINSADGHAHRIILGIPVDTANLKVKTSLVFKRYGDRYFLAQVWPGSSRGNQLPTSRAEREMITRIQRPVPVTVVASRK